MADVTDLAGLSEPAKTAIDRFSEMCSAVVHPFQVVRNAKAEATAELIKAKNQVEIDKVKALGELEVSDVQRRGLLRLAQQEGVKQQNMEDVIEGAKPLLNEDARPEDVDRDWTANFFDKVGLVSDADMKVLWSRVLAGEANAPGTFSKRTVNLLQELDKKNADAIVSLCRFSLNRSNDPVVLIYQVTDDIYSQDDINGNNLLELQTLGILIYAATYHNMVIYRKQVIFDYFDRRWIIFTDENIPMLLNGGSVILTNVGKELARLCTPEPVPGFAEYLVAKWRELGYTVEELPPAENTP